MRSLFFRLYLLIILTLVGLGWSLDSLYEANLQSADVTTDVDLHKGTLFLLNRELSRLPADAQAAHLEAVSGSFGYPIALFPLPLSQNSHLPFQLGEQQAIYLERGGLVTFYDDEAGTSYFVQKLNAQDRAVMLGPIRNQDVSATDSWLTTLFLIGLALSVFLWVWPISRGILRLSQSADEFGSGKLNTRIPNKLAAPLDSVADHFNTMADRIERLIQSHKFLSHAVSHELRTPIARIRFAQEIIRDAESKATRDRHLTTMDKNIAELDSLVEELLIYARFDREEPKLALSEVPLRPLLETAIEPFKQQYQQLRFSVSGELDEDTTLHCDKAVMQRLIDNLLRNAVRYARQHIEINVAQPSAAVCIISVNDDGKGIPEADRHELFSPFVRLDQSRDRNSGGIGLGLAIVKRYIDLHNGNVSIGTSPLGGASFILELPVR